MLESHLPYGAKLLSSLASKLNGFAKQSRLVQRVSDRFRPEDFLLTLLDAVPTNRHPSINSSAVIRQKDSVSKKYSTASSPGSSGLKSSSTSQTCDPIPDTCKVRKEPATP
jgi:hypothetical protein